ncbi:MAG: diaminopimelate epimerase [Firmicutes bacterium]|nr:diaminopimelate epimerase [Bacillota bacterium]
MRFTKMHGLGNDFIVVEAWQDLPDGDLSALARQICQRRWGVGGDGLVFLLPSEVADLRMHIYNADGSVAEMCGNALRCVSQYVYEHGYCQRPDLKVETLDGIKQVHLEISDQQVKLVKVDMGLPILEPTRIPMLTLTDSPVEVPIEVLGERYVVTGVAVGVPHAVVFVPDVNKVDVARVGASLEQHPIFPRGANVDFVQVINSRRVMVRVWERGVGVTLACGTGACAVVVAGVLNGLTDEQVDVELPGGTLQIYWQDRKRLYMTGPAKEVFTGKWPLVR